MAKEDTSDFNKLILFELKSLGSKQESTTQCVQDLTTDFKLHQQKSDMRWDTVVKLDTEQNKLLADHSARSTAIQKDVELREIQVRSEITKVTVRVDKLEEPRKLFKAAKSVAIWITTVGTSVIVVSKLLGFW